MKKALLILSFIALAAACDKHDNDYKEKIPPAGYTLDDLTRLTGRKYRNADHFIQGYMSVSSVKIDKEITINDYRLQLSFSLEGDIVKGGNMKGDPCDEGFEQLAQKYDDVYGDFDALSEQDMDNGVIMTADKIEYYVYLAKGDYSPSLKEGALLNDHIGYDLYIRRHKEPFEEMVLDEIVPTKWKITEIKRQHTSVEGYRNIFPKEFNLTETRRNIFYIPLPPQAGVHSFRFVAKKDGKIICDELIEDLELPAENPSYI